MAGGFLMRRSSPLFQQRRTRPLVVTFSSLLLSFLFLSLVHEAAQAEETRQVMIRDITTVEGIRENPLIGYGVVVGLKRTGDSQQTLFTTQTLANVLQRLGVQISPATVQVRN